MKLKWSAAVLGLAMACVACSGDPITTSTVSSSAAVAPESTTTSQQAGSSTTPAPTTTGAKVTTTVQAVDVVITSEHDDEPEISVQGPAVFTFAPGDQVEILILSSVDDEVHVHGYDLRFATRSGEVTRVEFVAGIPGVFEVELEESHHPLFDIEVSP